METLEEFVSKMDDRVFLPGLQREFVWTEDAIAHLFDSFIRGYPVGQVTLWDTDGVDDKFTAYRFIRRYVDEDGRIPPAVLDHEARRSNEQANTDNIICDYLVIDGQQRLNSAYVGLRGSLFSYTGGRGGDRSDERFWSEKVLCIDLLGNPEFSDASGLPLAGDYDFKFRTIDTFDPENEVGHEEMTDGTHRLWYPIRRFVNEDGEALPGPEVDDDVRDQVNALEISATSDQRDILKDVASRVAMRFQQKVLGYELPSTTVKYDPEEVHEIFTRINLSGERPKPYQYVQSLLATYSPYVEEDDSPFHPRLILTKEMERMATNHPVFEKKITRKLLTRCLVYVANSDLKRSTVEKYSEKDEVRTIHEQWAAPGEMGNAHGRFEQALRDTFSTVEGTGLTPRTIPSMDLIAILTKFYYVNPAAEVTEENKRAVFRFVAKTVFTNTFSRSRGRAMARAVNEVYPNGDGEVFFGDALLDAVDVRLTSKHVDDAVDRARYNTTAGEDDRFTHSGVAAVLALLDEAHSEHDIDNLAVDHIYPVAQREAIAAANDGEINLHRIGNLQLLNSSENASKGDNLPDDWLSGKSDGRREFIRDANLYPDGNVSIDKYNSFVERREKLMKDWLTERYAASSMNP
ncbi:DUF262 domain-containing HNH endonuclease family protein [Halococcus dombrowskii]|nr:DUF262 domain-containing protein [Halococcus dombrowskii]UOO95619.1 DUF262 domain-containing HNH endonuclease family protein [Halococcus dombrowskii]